MLLCYNAIPNYTPTRREGAILLSPCPSVRSFVRSHFRNGYLSFYRKKWFYIWYMALEWWLVPCLPFPGLPHIYFLLTVRLRIFHVCRNENFRNSYLSFYWKKWFYICIWLWHGVSPFQVYHTSASYLPCDLQMNEWGYS
jgi:hypothetical protein